jgi:hypothetical protein
MFTPYPALHLFGRQSFFQPYLPLQQVEMLTTRSWLVGTTNQIVTQQRDCKYDLLVNVGLQSIWDLKQRLIGADRKRLV